MSVHLPDQIQISLYKCSALTFDFILDIVRGLILGGQKGLHFFHKIRVTQQRLHNFGREARSKVHGGSTSRPTFDSLRGHANSGQEVLQIRQLNGWVGRSARWSTGRRGRGSRGRGRCSRSRGGGRSSSRGGSGSGRLRSRLTGRKGATGGGRWSLPTRSTSTGAEQAPWSRQTASEQLHELLLTHIAQERLEIGFAQIA